MVGPLGPVTGALTDTLQAFCSELQVLARPPELFARHFELRARLPELFARRPQLRSRQPKPFARSSQLRARQPELLARRLDVGARLSSFFSRSPKLGARSASNPFKPELLRGSALNQAIDASTESANRPWAIPAQACVDPHCPHSTAGTYRLSQASRHLHLCDRLRLPTPNRFATVPRCSLFVGDLAA